MDYLVRKVLTETEYAALKDTLDPHEGVLIVSDVDRNDVLMLAIGETTFSPTGSGGAPTTLTYLTNTDETADLPNSVDLGATYTTVGGKSILMNNPAVFGVANIQAQGLTEADSGFLFVDNSGSLTQSRSLNFTTTGGAQDVTFDGMDTFTCNANAYALNGSTVTSDTGFDGFLMTTSAMTSNNNQIVFQRQDIAQPLRVYWAANVEAEFQGEVYFTGQSSSTGTDLVVDGANRLYLKTSSQRFKEDIKQIEITHDLLAKVYELNPVTYRYKNGSSEEDATPQKTSIGLVAEEVQKLFPEVVNLDKDGLPFSLDYNGISVLLLAAIKELKAENNKLALELQDLKIRLGAVE